MGIFLPLLILGPLSEEIGWRGYALERLQTRWNALTSSLIVGLVWALWHLPLFMMVGTSQYELRIPFIGFLIGFPVAAFVGGWVMERTTLPVGYAAAAGSVLGGIAVLYAFGIVGLSIMLGKTLTEAAHISVAFLPGDTIKVVLAGVITHTLAQLRPNSVLSRA